MAEQFATVNATLRAPARSAWKGGREYLVVEAVMIPADGVLAGSDGPLHYPSKELAASAAKWNGVPLTFGHPAVMGMPISAEVPGVVDRLGLGFVDAAQFDGRHLRGQAWVDVRAAERVAPGLLDNLLKGEAVEISTGLFHSGGPLVEGIPSVAAVQPDHLAILSKGTVGACSVAAGCGIRFDQINNCGKGAGCGCGKILPHLYPETENAMSLYSGVRSPFGPAGVVVNVDPGQIGTPLPDVTIDWQAVCAERYGRPVGNAARIESSAPGVPLPSCEIDWAAELAARRASGGR